MNTDCEAMKTSKETKVSDIWNEDKQKGVKEFMLSHSQKQSAQRKLRKELLAIQYMLEGNVEIKKG